MITVKVNPYTYEDKRALAVALRAAEAAIMQECDKKTVYCKTCPVRHACYDITSAKEHAIRLTITHETE